MKIIEQSAVFFALFLIAAFLISLCAKWHWFPALLSHFAIQYCVGALILLPFALFLIQSYPLAFTLITIACMSLWHIHGPMHKPWSFQTTPMTDHSFSVALHNKHYTNKNYTELHNALKDHDIVLIIEAEQNDIVPLITQFKETHPFSPPAQTPHPDEMIIFSKHDITDLSFPPLCDKICGTQAVRFTLNDPNITFYAFHTKIPIGAKDYAIHRAEINGAATLITQDKSKHIIAMGDWNTTPYAPAFHAFLKQTNLRYQNHGLQPQSTWPSWFIAPIFKIPIDHIVHSPSLTLHAIKKGMANGSDHHSLIAHFSVSP